MPTVTIKLGGNINNKGGVIIILNIILSIGAVFAIIAVFGFIMAAKLIPKIKFWYYSMASLAGYLAIYLILHLQV